MHSAQRRPLVPPDAGVRSAPPDRPGSGAPGRVLVIDDEDLMREAITDLLACDGIGVVTAADGRSGIARHLA